jgi:hypothetical protein
MNQSFDIIGDIHGYADELEALLKTLGYECREGCYMHPSGRKVIFLGDYIDRGPKIGRTLHIVKAMYDSGDALAIMGNHEFNAIAWATSDGNGGYLRPHNDSNMNQHRKTVEFFKEHPILRDEYLRWFMKLPLWLDLPGLRVVHANWDIEAVEVIHGDNRLNPELLVLSSTKGQPEYEAVELLLKGREIRLPEGLSFHDKDGHERNQIRVKWWLPREPGQTYRDLVFPNSDSVPGIPVSDNAPGSGYPRNAPPVFFGHYWLPLVTPLAPLASNVACLDYSVAKGGFLAAYRWDGERNLRTDNFVRAKEDGTSSHRGDYHR